VFGESASAHKVGKDLAGAPNYHPRPFMSPEESSEDCHMPSVRGMHKTALPLDPITGLCHFTYLDSRREPETALKEIFDANIYIVIALSLLTFVHLIVDN